MVPVRALRALTMLAAVAAPVAARAEGAAHGDPFARVVLWLALILVAAKVGGELASRAGQPAVLGEIVAGIVLGNLPLAGIHGLEGLATDASIDVLARLGVLVLLFQVGLASTVRQMLEVGLSSLAVATLVVAAPFALGWLASRWLLPGAAPEVHAFLGATLSATSVGITARVLQDLHRTHTREARIILGAAVVDDVLGLVILAVVAGAIEAAARGGTFSAAATAGLFGKATAFLVAALGIGAWLSPRVFRIASRLQTHGVLLATGLAACFVFSWAAAAMGLAAIVGAFAAGLVLEDVHYRDFTGRGEQGLDVVIHPIADLLVPVFFVLMGARTTLAAFGDARTLALSAVLTAAAVVGKQACSLGVLGKGVDRLSVGIGMIPRGEVGLIFASMGAQLTVRGRPVLDAAAYSAIVLVVVATTLVTPPALRWSLTRRQRD